MANFTREAILAAFLKIAEKKPLEKISVRDIVDECGINRNTFYYHFQDIYAVLEEVLVNQILITESDGNSPHYLVDVTNQTIIQMLQHKPAIQNIYRSVGPDMVDRYMKGNLTKISAHYVNSKLDGRKMNPWDKNMLISFYRNIIGGAMKDWLEGGMKENPSYIVQHISRLMTGMAELGIRNSLEMSKEKEQKNQSAENSADSE
ncbi:MAG: TetR/AcrR family transcriptional regulator [Clostridia bacterium]|nr:TetR/AcrR family transcriptional regulator [Clostridia bacterium]